MKAITMRSYLGWGSGFSMGLHGFWQKCFNVRCGRAGMGSMR